jgi:N-methylhydantoinase A
VREVSVGKGHDPRTFLFLAYGGTLPLFASQIAERLGISTIVIPQNSSVFCALGLLSSDFVLRNDQGVGWDLSDPSGADRVNAIATQMVATAASEMQGEGFAAADIEIRRSADLRFQGQEYELSLPLPDRPLVAQDTVDLAAAFVALYERTYGEGTAWEGVPVTMVNHTVTAIGRQARPTLHTVDDGDAADERVEKRASRRVFLPAERRWEEVAVYDDARLLAGMQVSGPAIIDAGDTTIYVPPATTASRDRYMNYVLTQ